MGLEGLSTKSPATLDELKMRDAQALQRHPLCRNVQFEVVSTPGTSRQLDGEPARDRATCDVGGFRNHRRYPVADEFSRRPTFRRFSQASAAALSSLRRNRGPFKP